MHPVAWNSGMLIWWSSDARLIAIGLWLASRFPIQLDAERDVQEPFYMSWGGELAQNISVQVCIPWAVCWEAELESDWPVTFQLPLPKMGQKKKKKTKKLND